MRELKAPRFWWRRHSPTGYALAPLGALYGRISGRRMAAEGMTAPVPVICVGNLVLGGAGKTPTVLEVAATCRKLGFAPGFLTRGYRGRESGPLIVALPAHTAADVGDEALLLAEHGPTVVAADRAAGAKLLASLNVDVIVMDDGFQNPSLRKDLALVVVDGARGTGNGLTFPAGPLRAPLLEQMRHAHALVVLGEGSGGAAVRVAARAGLPIMRARVEAARRRGLRRKPYLAFAGIADPAKFLASLAQAGAEIGATMNFGDHHIFSEADCEAILRTAEEKGLVPITTEKDRVRLAGGGGGAERLLKATEVFPIRVRFGEPRRLISLIEDALAAHAGVCRRGALSPDARATARA